MPGNKIYQALILLFIITACAPPSADVSGLDSTEQKDTSAIETENNTESLESQLETEREARLEAERKLEEMKRRQAQTNETAGDKPKVKAESETLKTPEINSGLDIASEYDRVVDAYVDYLDGLPGYERSSACSSEADLSQLNKLQRAALRDACDVAGNNNLIVKPTYPQRRQGTDPQPQSEPQQQPQQQPQPDTAETVDSLIKIFKMVLRGFGR